MSSHVVGERHELARYRLPEGQRALFGQRIDGRVAVVDLPVDHDRRVYLVERHVTSQNELDGLITDYTVLSETSGRPAIVACREATDTRRSPAWSAKA